MSTIESVKQIVIEAGKLLRRLEGNAEVYRKEHLEDKHDIVTSADLAVEKFVCESLRKEFPDYQIFTEETDFADVTSEYFWSIDPIDGTKNFAAGIPLVGISIGLLRDFVPVMGVILNPYTGELFYAEKGNGAFKNGKKITACDTAHISDAMVILEGKDMGMKRREYARELLIDARTLRNFGCATLDMMYIAEGRAQGYIDEDLKYYDISAGTIIVQEAGGKVTNTKNEPIFPRKPGFEDIDVVATNGRIHDVLIEYISRG